MYFLKKITPRFPPKEKMSCFGEKNTIFPDNTRKIMSRHGPPWKDHLFRAFEETIIFPCIFWERSSFIFRLRGKIIFSGKGNIIFSNNTRKIIFQHDFFWKDHLFRTSGKRKYGFPCSENSRHWFIVLSEGWRLKNWDKKPNCFFYYILRFVVIHTSSCLPFFYFAMVHFTITSVGVKLINFRIKFAFIFLAVLHACFCWNEYWKYLKFK